MDFKLSGASEMDTMVVARLLARAIDDRAVIFLAGDLGAGKTTFVRGVMRELGFSGAVKSPTFTLVEPYELDRGQVYHFDLYRLGHPEELEYLGVDDYFNEKALCFIEWPEKGDGYLPDSDIVLSIEPLSVEQKSIEQVTTEKRLDSETRDARQYTFEAKTDIGQEILRKLKGSLADVDRHSLAVC